MIHYKILAQAHSSYQTGPLNSCQVNIGHFHSSMIDSHIFHSNMPKSDNNYSRPRYTTTLWVFQLLSYFHTFSRFNKLSIIVARPRYIILVRFQSFIITEIITWMICCQFFKIFVMLIRTWAYHCRLWYLVSRCLWKGPARVLALYFILVGLIVAWPWCLIICVRIP